MTKKDKYIASFREIEIRLGKGGDLVADLGNIAAVLKKRLDYYWIGFYFIQSDRLVLGPFQGTPACVFLNLNGGVCATCVREKKTIVVPDVHAFESHVACDPSSQSEIVVPCFDAHGSLRAVLDMDHTEKGAFDAVDQEFLEKLVNSIKHLWRD